LAVETIGLIEVKQSANAADDAHFADHLPRRIGDGLHPGRGFRRRCNL
jgi:hypothetical protein